MRADQLLEAERLHEVVVAAERQTAHLVVGAVARGQEQHRCAAAVGAQPPAHLETVEVRKHHVEDDQIGSHGRSRIEGLPTVRGRVHLEADVAQRGFEHRAKVLFVVDEEQAFLGHRGQRSNTRRNSMEPLSSTCAGPPLGAPIPHSSHVIGMLPCTAI